MYLVLNNNSVILYLGITT